MPTGVYPRTEWHKQCLREASVCGTPEYRKKMSLVAKQRGYGKWMLGKKPSQETRERMSVAQKGRVPSWPKGKKRPEEFCQKVKEAVPRGENNYLWKGSEVGYRALHSWVCRMLGKPRACSECYFESDNSRQFHWANVSHQYKRDLDDWIRLCVKCHKAYDSGRLELLSIEENI